MLGRNRIPGTQIDAQLEWNSRNVLYSPPTMDVSYQVCSKNWTILLDRLIERVYLLRCQLIHGAVTCGSKLNRTALKRSTLMPETAGQPFGDLLVVALLGRDRILGPQIDVATAEGDNGMSARPGAAVG